MSKPDKPFQPKTIRGHAGETHQLADSSTPTLTTDQGVPIADNQNSLKAGRRGPTTLEDHILRDKLTRFDRERIPERVVHARGYGAHGYFEAYESLKELTRAAPFQKKGHKTPVFMRISTVAGSKGSADLARDVRGFAIKFYTEEGNWDIVGNNIPVFFIQDAIKFPDLVHSVKPEPDREFPQAQSAHDNFWDFVSLTPESTHMLMWIMSDRTIPRSLRFIEGFGVHTFRLVNAKGESQFVKFHFKPKLGLQSVAWPEAVKINGADPDYHRRDMWETLNSGTTIEWEMGMQIIDERTADSLDFDILDPTKLIPEEVVPVRIVGRLVLDRAVDNAFAETEQVAFSPQNIIPGIDFSEDPLLQGRTFSYFDTHQSRLGGPNFNALPINAPRCPVHNFAQDGIMPLRQPQGRVNYEPNSWGGPRENPQTGFQSYQAPVGETKVRIRPESFADHYSQARLFYISQTPIEQAHIKNAFVFELSKLERVDIRERVVGHLLNVDKELAKQVADGLGFEKMPPAAKAAVETRHDLSASDALSIAKNAAGTFKGRKLGILITDGTDTSLFNAVKTAAELAGATVCVIAPKVVGAKGSDGVLIPANEKIGGAPSVLFDAIAVLPSKEGGLMLAKDASTKDFMADAFAHCKYIGYASDAISILETVGVADNLDQACIELTNQKSAKAFIQAAAHLRFWDREAKVHKV